MFLLGNGELFCSYSETGSCFVPTRKRGAVLFLLKSRELFWCMLNPTAARLGYLVYSHTEAGGCFAPTLKQGADFFPTRKEGTVLVCTAMSHSCKALGTVRVVFWCVLCSRKQGARPVSFCSNTETGSCLVPTQKQGGVLVHAMYSKTGS